MKGIHYITKCLLITIVQATIIILVK